MNNKTHLFINPNYRTQKKSISLVARLFPSIYFYIKTIWIVIKSGYKAHYNLYTSEDWIHDSENIVKNLEGTGCCIEIDGLSNIQNMKEPCVIIANHMSTLETFTLPSMIQPWKPVTFVVKKSLLSYPFFGNILQSRKPIAINRNNPREDFSIIMKEGLKRLNSGTSVIVFPQSTRSNTFIPEKFNSIGVKLAKHANVPIIPLAIKSDAWGNGSILKDFGPIHPQKTVYFIFSKPIYINGNGKQEHKKICTFISDCSVKWSTQKEQPMTLQP